MLSNFPINPVFHFILFAPLFLSRFSYNYRRFYHCLIIIWVVYGYCYYVVVSVVIVVAFSFLRVDEFSVFPFFRFSAVASGATKANVSLLEIHVHFPCKMNGNEKRENEKNL